MSYMVFACPGVELCFFCNRWAFFQQEGPRMHETLQRIMEKLGEALRFSAMSEQEWIDGPVKVKN